MFLCHFPSGCPAWALPSALPFGARTFLPVTGATERSPGLLDQDSVYQRRRSASPALVSGVQRQIRQFIRPLVLRPGHGADREGVELTAKLKQSLEERAEPLVAHLVAKLQLPDDQL